MRLQNKNAIVTGAARGIGKAIAIAFAKEGANVAILDVNQDQADQVAEQINAEGNAKAWSIECDVGYADQVASAFEQADGHLGQLDIMVANAAIIRNTPVVDMPEDEWDLIIRNNLKSVFLCSQQGARRMAKHGKGGRIIALSSIHAVLSEPNCSHYTAAKGGIESFCRTLATELAPHRVTVNYIRPGATFTELTIPMYTESVTKSLFDRVPMKEIAQPEWIASGAVYLASDEARYMTGQHLTIDGGYIMDGSLPGAVYWE